MEIIIVHRPSSTVGNEIVHTLVSRTIKNRVKWEEVSASPLERGANFVRQAVCDDAHERSARMLAENDMRTEYDPG
jgi:hypothetical protein